MKIKNTLHPSRFEFIPDRTTKALVQKIEKKKNPTTKQIKK